ERQTLEGGMRPNGPTANVTDLRTPAPRRWRAGGRAVLTGLCFLHAAAVLGVCLALHLAGDRWWLATLLLFAPRWPWALPLIVLVPLALLGHRRLLWLLAVVAGLVLVPIMGLCLPWGAASAETCTGPTLRVLTCNVHHG